MDAQIATNGTGDYALGFTIDGAFIPIGSVAKHRVEHLVERQATLKARADDPAHEGHGPAVDALEDDWKVVAGLVPSSSSTSEGTGDGNAELEARIAALEAAGATTEVNPDDQQEA